MTRAVSRGRGCVRTAMDVSFTRPGDASVSVTIKGSMQILNYLMFQNRNILSASVPVYITVISNECYAEVLEVCKCKC